MAGAIPPRPEGEEALSLASTLSGAVRRLHLDVMARVDELLPGDGVARVGGGGVEVAGVREYHPGDEVRGIDWRVTARRGRLHVKVFAPERDQAVLLVLHRSPALRGGRGGIREIRSLETTALLAAVAVKEGRRVGLLQSRAGRADLLEPRRGRHQLLLLLNHLLEWGGETGEGALGRLLEAARHGLRERTRVFLVGDLSGDREDASACRAVLRSLAHRHALTAVPVRDRLEGDFPPVGSLLLRDPGNGRTAVIDTRGRRAEESVHADVLQERGPGVHGVEVQEPLLPQLRALLDGGGERGRRRA